MDKGQPCHGCCSWCGKSWCRFTQTPLRSLAVSLPSAPRIRRSSRVKSLRRTQQATYSPAEPRSWSGQSSGQQAIRDRQRPAHLLGRPIPAARRRRPAGRRKLQSFCTMRLAAVRGWRSSVIGWSAAIHRATVVDACHHLAAESSTGERKYRESAQVNGIVSHPPES